MSTPESLLQILSRQTTADNLDCIECCGAGEQLVFDSQNGHDYVPCEACQGSGYNLLGMLVHGLLQPPEEGFGPQALKASLAAFSRKVVQSPEASAPIQPDLEANPLAAQNQPYSNLKPMKRIS